MALLCLVASCGGGGGTSYGGGGGGGGNPPSPSPGAQDQLLNGHYAFLFSGFFHGYFTGVGSFTADGAGNINGGLVDTNGTGSVTTNGSFTGTYTLGQNNTGTMTLSYSDGSTVVYGLTVSPTSGNGRFIQYEVSGVQGSGIIKKQDPTAFAASKVTGNYAFGMSGLNGPASARLALVGQFQADGVSTLSGTADGNNNGTQLTGETVSGSYAVASSGRGTATLTVTGLGTLSTAFYVISANELFMMEIDSVKAGNPLLAGDIQKQSSSSFATASLNGTAVMQAIGQATSPSSAATALLGLSTANTPGTLAINADLNSGGTLSTVADSMSYSVSPNGRVTTSGSASPPVLYLTGANQGFVLFNDNNVTFGSFEPQAAGPFSMAAINGAYEGGSSTLTTPGVAEVDALTGTGNGNLSEAYTSSDGTTLLQGSRSLTYSTAADGRTMLTAQGSSLGILYVVSSTKVVVLGTISPALSTLEQ